MQDALLRTRRLAVERSRQDLVERLDASRRTLAVGSFTVAVVGEFKRGKSALVNALIQRPVCPVDADIVTAVPTLVRYGHAPQLEAHRLEEDATEPIAHSVPLEQLSSLAAETAQTTGPRAVSLEVALPHRMLRSGLRLLDTPGVGGLESVHGQLTLGSLTAVAGVLFVTDASQELTAPEMEFLRVTLSRCSRVALVVSKIDLHQHWRRIVELDREHLARAGIEIPVIPVSSLLRMEAAGRPALNEESGFRELIEFLARDVVRAAAEQAAKIAAYEVDFVADQLSKHSDAERVVLARPEESARVVERLSAASGRAQALTSRDSSWQQLLSDGVQDLVADVEHDLHARLRQVLKETRDLIDQSDPRDTWVDTATWLRRQVAAAGVANRDLLVGRAEELTRAVASHFSTASGEAVDVQLDVVVRSLDELQLPSASMFSTPGGRLASLIVTARTTALVPMMAVTLAGFHLLPVVALAGGAVLVTTGVGGKLFRDESRRQRELRRQQAKAAAAKFVEEAGFEMNKATRDSLRQTQRLLRDEFQARAQMLHASASGAVDAARRARALDGAALARRTTELEEETARLAAVRRELLELSGAGAVGG